MSFDRSNTPHDVQNFGNNWDRGVKKMDLTSASQWLIIPDHTDFDFDGDFTIEIFGAELDAITTPQVYLCHGGLTPNWSWYLIFQDSSGDKLAFVYSTNGTSVTAVEAAWSPTADVAYDLCVDRSGSDLRIYIDGVMLTSGTVSGALHTSSEDFYVSRLGPGSFGEGKIRLTGVRITKGVARYADDGGYTVPTLPLPTQ